jgi:hypothetical protein
VRGITRRACTLHCFLCLQREALGCSCKRSGTDGCNVLLPHCCSDFAGSVWWGLDQQGWWQEASMPRTGSLRCAGVRRGICEMRQSTHVSFTAPKAAHYGSGG